MNPPQGRWRLIAPAEDSTSAREFAGALIWQALVDAAKMLGLRVNWDETAQKLYFGLPLKSAAKPRAVPVYYSQRDSQVVIAGENQAGRMCFSSTCAMLLKDLKPNALSDSQNADDEYLRRVLQFGDTTQAAAQLKALAHFGVAARFTDRLSVAELDAALAAGKIVPIGVLHHGHVSRPTGGGHYLLVYAKEGNAYRVHDPYGEMDLVNGGYLNSNGKSLLYSQANLAARWCVENPHSGYAILTQ